ncbi:hypothetical protein ACFXG1_01830 [Streptomyces sp. NPDC059248]|uniref:hypothetical protein n=1 Tax=Streptomyces sp. NPDC059248 TaxID=3346791 RepID=UPI003699359C
MPTPPSAAQQTAPSGPSGGEPGPADVPPAAGPADSADDVVRWAAFSCLLVPVVLVVYGASVGGAAAAALGLAAVTAACRILLRRSERNAARAARENTPDHRARPARGAWTGVRRGTGPTSGRTPGE